MFEKLISLIPYNPGMSHQLAFYGQRMRQEASIRRTSLIFLILAFMIQFLAVVSPPGITSAASNNDLINGGFNSAASAAQDCKSNLENYGKILLNYGITCTEVANSPTVTIQSTDHSRDLFSMGRLPYGLAGETPVTIDGGTYYVRYLWSWDKGGPASTYQALRILSENGTLFYLLYGCGNLVSVGIPVPYTPPPSTVILTPPAVPPYLQVIKTTLPGYPAANSSVAPSSTLGYNIYVDNLGSTANNVRLEDTLPPDTTFQSMSLNAGASEHTYDPATRTATWAWDTIPHQINNYVVQLKLTVNSTASNNEQLCNKAGLTASNAGGLSSNQVCMTVRIAPTPSPTPTPISPPPTPTPTPAPAPVTPTPCALDTTIPATSSECKPCEDSLSSQDTTACVVVHKTASNVTQGLSDANNTTADAGDVILYTLYADNTGSTAVNNFTFQEDLSDVMDYANPVDLHGGSIDDNDIVSWPSQSIAPGQTASEQITVKVKSPIPSTPVDPNDPGHFNLIMTNVYGNTININVPGNTTTSIETTSSSLPNTGPGTSIFVAALIVIISTYFYSRARLLAKESAMAVKQNSGGLN